MKMILRAHRRYAIPLLVILLATGSFIALKSQTPGREVIRTSIDERRRVTLGGNTRPEVSTGNDLGAVDDSFAMDHMTLQLKRSPEQEQAVADFAAALYDPRSPEFHKWLTPEEYGLKFGVAEADLLTIRTWLESRGFVVNTVFPSGMAIEFSGNAGQVRNAFHTSIHRVEVDGAEHIANTSDPQIPVALEPAVAGVVSMHDFRPRRMARPRPARSSGPENDSAQYTFTQSGQVYQAVVPADLATIYNFNPLFANGITGTGQTIALLEDTNLYTTADWNTFRTTFGLAQYSSGSLVTVHPGNCGSPGVNSDDVEAILDAEWALAAAPGATIEIASCPNSATTFGVYTAALNLVNSSLPPSIMSISYGECEAFNGVTSNAAFNSLYQQAATEGISVFVASGDQGAAGCDGGQTSATHGIAVSALASTPYNVAVGGTDFADGVDGTANKYWSPTNSSTYGSALSYIPEIPWNDSCASGLFATYMGYSTVYGANGFCNSSFAIQGGYQTVGSGSGGPSGCATGAPLIAGVTGGTCQGFSKPAWQTGVTGIAADGVRDIPDVSMFASDGYQWGHYSVVCFSDVANGGSSCRGNPSSWAGFGGTSIAAPVMAGVQALVNQNKGAAQGNPNPVYYSLAARLPGIFHSVTRGDIAVNCGGQYNCFGVVGNIVYGRGGRVFGTTYGGALSVSSTSFTPAFGAGGTWNFATGLGSVDVNNLVTNWSK